MHLAQQTLARWVATIVVLITVAVLGLFFLLPPVLRSHREKRLSEFIQRGEAARQKEDFGVWWAHLMAAKEINAADPRVLRGIAQHMTHFRMSGGLAYWKALEQLGGINREDRLQWAILALALERADLAREALGPLLKNNARDPVVLGLVSKLFELEGDSAGARAAAKDAAALAPGDPTIELRLASLDLHSDVPAVQARGKSLLVGLLARPSAIRGEAGFLFLQMAGGNPTDRRLLRQLMGNAPAAPFTEQVLRLVLAMVDDPDSTERLAEEFSTRHKLHEPTPQLGYAVEQIGRLGESRLILALVPESLAEKDADLCRSRLGALAALGKTEDMQRLLALPLLPLPHFARAVFEAGLAQRMGRTNEAAILWPQAVTACREQPGALAYLARHAESIGALQVAIDAWEAQLRDTFLARNAAIQVLRLATISRDYLAGSVALRRLIDLQPDAWDLRLSLAFSQLLLNLPDPETTTTLEMEPTRFSSPDFFRVTRALQKLRADQPDQAMGFLDQVTADWATTPQGWRVVRAAALGRSGQSAQARTLAASLVPAQLCAAEIALVQSWLPAPTLNR